MEKRKIIKNNSKASIVPVLCESNTSVKDIFREIPFRFDVGNSLALMYSAGKRYGKSIGGAIRRVMFTQNCTTVTGKLIKEREREKKQPKYKCKQCCFLEFLSIHSQKTQKMIYQSVYCMHSQCLHFVLFSFFFYMYNSFENQ